MEGEERERVVGRKGREKERRRRKKWGEEGRIGKEEQEKERDGEHGVEKLRFLNRIHTYSDHGNLHFSHPLTWYLELCILGSPVMVLIHS